ncbi:sugar transferase [Dokdonia sp. 4H-3-7-5]|uniref:sugar transferase n=1 Tax=Dokdonia sp. (strain 4H-3-7-5) TaxID=983548 RepID=UPI00020A6C20|nr:sugar transferase [Dokdonia sp. 4H-3-7-5]AEE20737.1 Undecaprenyl-phosphate galactose phosphotransferase [Dokdonia sp. 4H-3-7-5]
MWYKNVLKPLIDISCAFIGLIVIAPIILLITFLLTIANGGKPFYTQLRTGKDDIIFRIIKFRSMNDKRDRFGNLLPDAVRLTPVGKFIRKTSLDELPQLLNVLKGDMSFIGPRPLLPEYVELYSQEQRKRGLVKPGISGWAQVNGRNAISWERKFELDVWYVNNQSFLFDIKILLMTIKKVFISEGISQEGEATTTRFKG